MKKLVNESLMMPLSEFLEWWNEILSEYPDEPWEWIAGTLVNDEDSADDELLDHFIQGGIEPNLAKELLDHRNGFMNYGLEIDI